MLIVPRGVTLARPVVLTPGGSSSTGPRKQDSKTPMFADSALPVVVGFCRLKLAAVGLKCGDDAPANFIWGRFSFGTLVLEMFCSWF